LVNCPKCGSAVQKPLKSWPIPTRKPLKVGEKPKLAGIFECSECRARFRAAVESGTGNQQTASIKDMVGKIKGIKDELMLTLMNLREKIKTLETERASLMNEIENLREVAESRANALEDEVMMLREEVRSLKDLLGNTELQK
jgi:predicted  nucleic acid-binding Zn-ribbon protein